MDTYRAPAEWTLASEHRISGLYRLAFVVGALVCLGFTVAMARDVGTAAESPSIALLLLFGFLVLLSAFFSFVAVRASVGRVGLYREGITLTDLRGRTVSAAWSEVRRVVRIYSSAGRTGRRFAGWSIEHGHGRQLFVPVMYAGVEGQLERLAGEARIPFGERHR